MGSIDRYRWPIIVWLVLLFCWAAAIRPVRADEVYTFVIKKQEEKKKTRWSLAEWLDTRDRMRMMDLWLALHSPSPYEFYLGGEYRGLDNAYSIQGSAFRMSFAAYASIFGLSAEWQSGARSEKLGQVNVRIFGFNDQNTNITLQAGVSERGQDLYSPLTRGAVGGVSTTFYLARYFGITGLWRHYFAPAVGGIDLGTFDNRYEGGAFIDFSFFRVYGVYSIDSGPFLSRALSGYSVGSRIYF